MLCGQEKSHRCSEYFEFLIDKAQTDTHTCVCVCFYFLKEELCVSEGQKIALFLDNQSKTYIKMWEISLSLLLVRMLIER